MEVNIVYITWLGHDLALVYDVNFYQLVYPW